MSTTRLHPALRLLVAQNLVVDQLTAEVSEAFALAGIDSIVLKGPTLADWLYPGDVRPYGDSDLMVRPGDWDAAVAVLEGRGFENYLEPLAHPRMESSAGTAFVRGRDSLDLHCTLHGLGARAQVVADAFFADAGSLEIGGTELRVPCRAAVLLLVGLHAAHHSEGKPVEDLRRALARADQRLWASALELARSLDGVPVFASGLALLPEGEELARRLGIGQVRSQRHEMRRQRVPMAEGVDELLASGLALRERASIVRRELVPRAEFMRWWTPLARRGRPGLAVAYAWRVVWLLAHAPRAILARRRARRPARPLGS